MTVLITGGTGFLGANLAKKLVAEDQQVVMFELNPNLKIVSDIINKVELVRGDIANWAEVLNVVKKYKVEKIFHTAALLSDNAERFPQRAYEVNANGTYHVLEAARLLDVKTVIFTSTNGTYGDHIGATVSNDAPQFPRIIYGSTKVAGERLGEYYCYRFGVNFRGLRFPSVIGPGRGPGGVSTYTTLSVQNPALGLPYEIYVSPETKAPVQYVDDAVNALKMLSEAPEDKLTRRMYSMSGVACCAADLVAEVKKLIPDAALTFKVNEQIDAIVKKIPMMEDLKAQQDWGWQQQYNSLTALVEKFVESVRNNRELYV